jgi:hypothetical protein
MVFSALWCRSGISGNGIGGSSKWRIIRARSCRSRWAAIFTTINLVGVLTTINLVGVGFVFGFGFGFGFVFGFGSGFDFGFGFGLVSGGVFGFRRVRWRRR